MAGTWKPLTNQPTFNASTMLLLTDGTVMCADEGTNFSGSPYWWKLTPDAYGSYIDGTWSALANGLDSALFFASAVLRDGRVFVAGGEYNGTNVQEDLTTVQIYDPVTNTWQNISTATLGWSKIGDAPCCVLPDGRVLLGSIDDNRTAIYDPVANTWTQAASKNNSQSSEETWTLLPDQTVLTVNCYNTPKTEKYVIVADKWVDTKSTPSDLVEDVSHEIGPALLLPDGRVFAIGATSKTALYTMPPLANQAGTWADGPTFPMQNGQTVGAKDAPACLLPNGRVLCAVGPVDGILNPDGTTNYLTPTYFFEFDPAASTLSAITNPPNSGQAPFNGRLLLLPTGQVLFANGSSDIEVYTPDGTPDPSWQPQITSALNPVQPGQTYTLYGRQLNGLSQAVSYGDDASMATNYPLVRIRNLNSNKVVYCRTFNYSTMGVATGNVVHSTQFSVPAGIELGSSELCVIANGISSDCVTVVVSLKIWKEIKLEIKEFKENFKAEIDIVVKDLFEGIKLKDAEGDPGQRFRSDPEWLKAIRLLAERSDQIEERLRELQAFIREEERPKLGEEALARSEEDLPQEKEDKG